MEEKLWWAGFRFWMNSHKDCYGKWRHRPAEDDGSDGRKVLLRKLRARDKRNRQGVYYGAAEVRALKEEKRIKQVNKSLVAMMSKKFFYNKK